MATVPPAAAAGPVNATEAARRPILPQHRMPSTEGPEPARKYLEPGGRAGADVPPNAGSWTFSVLGDYGTGSRQQAAVAQNILGTKPELLLTVGDNVYQAGLEHEYRKKFDPPHLSGKVHAEIPMYPSLGNHDTYITTKPYHRRFPHLENARYYSFERGGVHFAALDTNETLAPGSPQHEWLNTTLQQARDGWKVLYMHHPMLSSASDRSEKLKIREYLGPLLAQHGVDLVLAGHDHNYERARPLNDQGTLFVRSGNGGKGNSGFDFAQPGWSDYRETGYGHLDVEVSNDQLVGRYMRSDGSIGDTWTVDRT